ncbi:hypothetical protein [Catellatospora tritici]|uniref:hypothetical protein n=1 Tax=Catellatospora tritici TaxID=2851566 RepID=UPI001C2D6A5F|nr:hypothetical protein [Catellatospora tritici]MBV1851580.1 hypothetical protein [Catellatospora tritici]
MDIGAWVELAEELVLRPYPEVPPQVAPGDLAQPGLYAVNLMVSRDFWDPEDRDLFWEQTLDEYEAVRDLLAAALTDRWGQPEDVDLLALRKSIPPDASEPPLVSLLSHYWRDVRLWHRSGRHVCLEVGQADKELPFQLLLAVGDM